MRKITCKRRKSYERETYIFEPHDRKNDVGKSGDLFDVFDLAHGEIYLHTRPGPQRRSHYRLDVDPKWVLFRVRFRYAGYGLSQRGIGWKWNIFDEWEHFFFRIVLKKNWDCFYLGEKYFKTSLECFENVLKIVSGEIWRKVCFLTKFWEKVGKWLVVAIMKKILTEILKIHWKLFLNSFDKHFYTLAIWIKWDFETFFQDSRKMRIFLWKKVIFWKVFRKILEVYRIFFNYFWNNF